MGIKEMSNDYLGGVKTDVMRGWNKKRKKRLIFFEKWGMY